MHLCLLHTDFPQLTPFGRPSISILGTLTYEHIETGRPDLEPSDNRRKRLDKRGARLQLVDAEAHEEDKSDGARVSHHELLTPYKRWLR